MHKSDYQAIAEAINATIQTATPEQDVLISVLIAKLCDVFLKNNSRFDADKFIMECTK